MHIPNQNPLQYPSLQVRFKRGNVQRQQGRTIVMNFYTEDGTEVIPDKKNMHIIHAALKTTKKDHEIKRNYASILVPVFLIGMVSSAYFFVTTMDDEGSTEIHRDSSIRYYVYTSAIALCLLFITYNQHRIFMIENTVEQLVAKFQQ